METDLDKLKGFILTTQAMAEQGDCLMLNVTDVLNEIERLQALSIAPVSLGEQSEATVCKHCRQPRHKHTSASYMCADRFKHFEQTEN